MNRLRAAVVVRNVIAFVRLGRFKFLAGGFVLYGLGAAVAARHHALDVRGYVWGQAAVASTQLMTHYANDYFDIAADRANTTPTQWSGGSRVLADGTLSPGVALAAARALGAVALLLSIATAVVAHSARALVVLLLALVLAWSYSAPPMRLHTRGVGAPSVALVVGILTPLAGWLVQGGDAIEEMLVVAAPIAFAIAAMILVIDFPDAEGDRAVGKRTPVVRFGPRVAARLAILCVLGAYASLAMFPLVDVPSSALYAVAATLPLGLWLVARLVRGDGERTTAWEGLARTGVAWLAAIVVLELAAWVRLAGRT